MNSFINAMNPTGNTYTANGAYTPVGTGNPIVDFFFHAAAMRDSADEKIIELFNRSFDADPLKTIRILFYVRDVRGGQGERRVFRVLLPELAKRDFSWLKHNLHLIPEYGRWDDLFCLLDTPLYKCVKAYITTQLADDYYNMSENKPCSLLAKWLPSENASSPKTKSLARVFQRMLDLTPRTYRKNLSRLRKHIQIVEHNLVDKTYNKIEYDKVPSKAGMKYRKAFLRNDHDRYCDYISNVSKGVTKINASTLYPYEIIGRLGRSAWNRTFNVSDEELAVLDAMWKNLPDYVGNINGLVVADTSGSMYGRPMEVSISLAMYIAERNKSEVFKDYFISFSKKPKFHHIQGNTIMERAACVDLGDIANTDIQAVFQLILDRAVKHNVPQEDMPEILYIVSDMEFDMATRNNTSSNFEEIQKKYKEAGYAMPKLVFWNVNSSGTHVPVTVNNRGVFLVSGCSPIILKYALALSGSIEELIDSVINNERYAVIE